MKAPAAKLYRGRDVQRGRHIYTRVEVVVDGRDVGIAYERLGLYEFKGVCYARAELLEHVAPGSAASEEDEDA